MYSAQSNPNNHFGFSYHFVTSDLFNNSYLKLEVFSQLIPIFINFYGECRILLVTGTVVAQC